MIEWKAKEKKLALSTLNKAARQFADDNGIELFINNVLTEGERVTIGRRLVVAQMILAGKTYFEVCEKFSISPNTFSNIRKWIHREMPNYNEVLEQHRRLEEERAKNRQKRHYEPTKPFGLADLSRRYPGHFLLFNLAGEIVSRNRRKRAPRKLK